MFFDPGESLRPALHRAQRQLEAASRAVARANAGAPEAVDAAMAQIAQASLFSEALLSAVHARLVEVKAATK